MATKYSVSIFDGRDWEGIALFANTVNLESMIEFCLKESENGNFTPNKDISIVDMETGEVLWDYRCFNAPLDDDSWGSCEPADIDNDCGYDPYLGCFTNDC